MAVTPSDLDGLHCGVARYDLRRVRDRVTPSDLDGLHCGEIDLADAARWRAGHPPSDLDGLHCGLSQPGARPGSATSPRPIWTGSIAAGLHMARRPGAPEVTPSDLDGLHCGRDSQHRLQKRRHVTPSDLDGLHCGVLSPI